MSAPSSPPKYRHNCANFASCGRKRRDGDIFCSKCYFKLPQGLRYQLHGSGLRFLNGVITLCLETLNPQDNREEA